MKVKDKSINSIAKTCIDLVFRSDTNTPGFVHLDFGKNLTSLAFRSIMVDLKNELSKFTLKTYHKPLTYHWLVRFNQQVNTPFHLDNAKDTSFLMLGYEPSKVESELYLADYAKYIAESKDHLKGDIDKIIPVFKNDISLLSPYISKVKSFTKENYSIVLINNSSLKSHLNMLGVLHKVTIPKQDLTKSRIVNSMIINLLSTGESNENEPNEKDFLNTSIISE